MCFFFQDAIRIMRRQRPGSVERKIQEETVAIFGRLLFEYGKSIMEEIERKERELRQLMKNEMEQVGMIYFDKGVILARTEYIKVARLNCTKMYFFTFAVQHHERATGTHCALLPAHEASSSGGQSWEAGEDEEVKICAKAQPRRNRSVGKLD